MLTTIACWIALSVICWRFPKGFAFVVIGTLLGVPVGLTVWTIAIQFADWLFTLPCAVAFGVTGWLCMGWIFARSV